MTSKDEPVMSEAEWARFMQRSDARAARYQELLETLLDHPDRDALIAQEMGWDAEPADTEGPADELAHADVRAWAPPTAESYDVEADEGGPETIRCFVLARAYGLKALRLLEPCLDAAGFAPTDDRSERIESLLTNSLIPAARIGGGHGMGYEPEVLGGHVVCCRQALEAAESAREDLRCLETHGHLPTAVIYRLKPRLDVLVDAIEERLAALRARVVQ